MEELEIAFNELDEVEELLKNIKKEINNDKSNNINKESLLNELNDLIDNIEVE